MIHFAACCENGLLFMMIEVIMIMTVIAILSCASPAQVRRFPLDARTAKLLVSSLVFYKFSAKNSYFDHFGDKITKIQNFSPAREREMSPQFLENLGFICGRT